MGLGLSVLDESYLVDDFDLIASFVDAGPGGDVAVTLDSGTILVFAGLGTGLIDSFADLVSNAGVQLTVGEIPVPFA